MSGEEGGGQQSIGRSRARIISSCQERCFKAVARYIEAANSLEDQQNARLAAAELHNAVLAYYRALRPLRDKEAVEDFWASAEWEFTDSSGYTQTLEGLGELEGMMLQTEQVEQTTQGFLGRRTTASQQPTRLPPRTLLDLAAKLDDAAVQLGFAPDVDDGAQQLYAIKKDPEDYGEPIDDSIPKPE